jgi:hypothetical protein
MSTKIFVDKNKLDERGLRPRDFTVGEGCIGRECLNIFRFGPIVFTTTVIPTIPREAKRQNHGGYREIRAADLWARRSLGREK